MNIDDGNPQDYLDWLVVQQTCEWCGGTIQHYAPDGQRLVPKAEWRCWEVKKGGYTSKHWKHWRICSTCHTKDFGGFGRWMFPIIANAIMPPMALSDIVAVQPMGLPDAGIMYMDYIHGPDRREGVCCPRNMLLEVPALRAYAERPLNPDNYVTYRITGGITGRASRNGVVNP